MPSKSKTFAIEKFLIRRVVSEEFTLKIETHETLRGAFLRRLNVEGMNGGLAI
jgi:hypothetical protein